jgi:hypothetical protein
LVSVLSNLNEDGIELDVYEFPIPHVVIRSHQQVSETKSRFLFKGQPLRVEEFARQIFVASGYQAFYGEDAFFFFKMLSFDFSNLTFIETYKAWTGIDPEPQLRQLKNAVDDSLAAGHLPGGVLDKAATIVGGYYRLPPKSEIHSRLHGVMEGLDEQQIMGMIRFCRTPNAARGGIPDLFITRGLDFWFAEVKSKNDSVSAEQYLFFEEFAKTVGPNILVVRVLSALD